MFPFTQDILDKAFTYKEFMAYAEEIYNSEKPIAPYDKESYMNYSKSNSRWSQRLTKKSKISDELIDLAKSIDGTWNWVLINEPWCGDGAFSLAFLHNLAEDSEGKINLKIVLRDKNHPIMNEYLTNGGMAIPKLVCLDENLNELLVWGPRPDALTEQLNEWKKDPSFDNAAKIQKVYEWYIKDKNKSIEIEFIKILKKLL